MLDNMTTKEHRLEGCSPVSNTNSLIAQFYEVQLIRDETSMHNWTSWRGEFIMESSVFE